MSTLLSFDQASRITGYTFFVDGKPQVINHFECTGSDLGDRLRQFRENIISLLDKYHPDEVIFEDIQLQDRVEGKKNTDSIQTFKTLAEVFGVLYELLTEREIKNTPIPPNVWKATFKIAGKGRTTEKRMAQEWVKNNYGVNCTEDEADSVCIGTHIIKKQDEEFDWS